MKNVFSDIASEIFLTLIFVSFLFFAIAFLTGIHGVEAKDYQVQKSSVQANEARLQ